MKSKIFIFFALIVNNSFGQKITAKVIDSISGLPIAYATIFLQKTPNKGTYSNEEGIFTINCSKLKPFALQALVIQNYV